MRVDELKVYLAADPARITYGFFEWWYPWVRGQLRAEGADVPCGRCTACCRNVDVHMLPEVDHPARYRTEARDDGRLYLQRVGPESRCTHLLPEGGCEVYADRPFMCRTFDCRVFPAGRILVVDPKTDHLTFACEAGMTRFQVIPRSPAERTAMIVAHAEATRLADDGMEAHVALAVGLLLWPRQTGGPAAHFLQTMQQGHAAVLDRIIAER